MYSEYAIQRPASITPIQSSSDAPAMSRAESRRPADSSQ